MRWITLAAAAAVPLLAGACDTVMPRRGMPLTDTDATAAAAAATTNPSPAPSRAVIVARRLKSGAVGGTVDERTAFAGVREWLRRLVVAEETYFAETGTYTGVLDSTRFRPPVEIVTTILWATRDGWAARARHVGIPGKDCVIYVGRSRPAPATMRLRRQAGEGVPACDAPSRAPQPAPTTPGPQRQSRIATTPPTPVSAPAPALPDTGSGLDAVSPIIQMKVDLRNLARSQELWFGTQGAYSWRVEPFAMQYLWHRGVKLRILSADWESWSAKAIHEALPGKSCVIWYGPVATAPRTDGQTREAVRAAVPVCDDP